MKTILVLCGLLVLQGCAVPLLTGVKTYKSGDTEITFITGADFHLGANGIDRVEDKRGIKPSDKE